MNTDAALQGFVAASSYTAPVDHKKLRFIFHAITEYARAAGKELGGLRVLEVGCGVGGITIPVATLGCDVRAIDLDRPDVEELVRVAGERGLGNIHATVDDAMAFDDGVAYDIVIASEVFEHLLDPGALADAIARRLVPGGRVIVTTPNGYGPWELANAVNPYRAMRRWTWSRRLVGRAPYDGGGGRDHCQRFTRAALEEVFTSRSFRPVAFAKSDFVLTTVRALRQSPLFGRIDTKMADGVPSWMASGWYFVFEYDTKHETQ